MRLVLKHLFGKESDLLMLPQSVASLLGVFVGAFTQPTFLRGQLLAIGALLALGPRTVTNILWSVRLVALAAWQGAGGIGGGVDPAR